MPEPGNAPPPLAALATSRIQRRCVSCSAPIETAIIQRKCAACAAADKEGSDCHCDEENPVRRRADTRMQRTRAVSRLAPRRPAAFVGYRAAVRRCRRRRAISSSRASATTLAPCASTPAAPPPSRCRTRCPGLYARAGYRVRRRPLRARNASRAAAARARTDPYDPADRRCAVGSRNGQRSRKRERNRLAHTREDTSRAAARPRKSAPGGCRAPGGAAAVGP